MREDAHTQCCIVGCGPAGAMLGLLLARAGVDVVVLEKHGDFLRDFRGDDLAPSTLEVLDQVGLAGAFLDLGPNLVRRVELRTPTGVHTIADFRDLPSRFRYGAVIPQWDFLEFLIDHARRSPCFHLHRNVEATDVIEEGGEVRGLRCRSDGADVEVRAALTVAADGRWSRVRERARLPLVESAPPVDLLWFRLPQEAGAADDDVMSISMGGCRVLGLIDRRRYWQVAYVIPKGSYDEVRRAGLEALRESIERLRPELAGPVSTLRGWDQVSLLSVHVNRLPRWHRPGLLCIGDAAHAMSPIGGTGINFAIQDAVAAANVLAGPLRRGRPADRDLARVQRQRAWQVRLMQHLQAQLTQMVLADRGEPGRATALLQRAGDRLLDQPALLRLRSRVIGLGIRPTRVRLGAA